ncbi:hypothetical protein ACJX0J_034432, partial [Zea mays]
FLANYSASIDIYRYILISSWAHQFGTSNLLPFTMQPYVKFSLPHIMHNSIDHHLLRSCHQICLDTTCAGIINKWATIQELGTKHVGNYIMDHRYDHLVLVSPNKKK